jgi:hypothetical protein
MCCIVILDCWLAGEKQTGLDDVAMNCIMSFQFIVSVFCLEQAATMSHVEAQAKFDTVPCICLINHGRL